VIQRNRHRKNRILKLIHQKKELAMGMLFEILIGLYENFSFFRSYPNLGLEKDPPYAYKGITDKYDATLDAQRVK
jgi:hypothetical protein